MPTVSAILTQYNAGNYHGRLIGLTPEDTAFTTLAGGMQDGQVDFHNTFEWQTYDLRDASETAQVVDAADAPSAENRRRANVYNVIETHTETVGAGFERLGQHQQFNVPGTSSLDAQNIGQGMNPVTDELSWQATQKWKEIKRDVEKSLINGTYNLPSDNTAAPRTRGIVEAITSNSINGAEDEQSVTADATADTLSATSHGYSDGDTVYLGGTTAPGGTSLDTPYYVVNATSGDFQIATTPGGTPIDLTSTGTAVTARKGKPLDDYLTEYAMQDAYDNGGLQEGDGRILMVPSVNKMQLTNTLRSRGIEVRSRNVLGVNALQVDTSFGPLSVVLNRHLTDGTALALSFEQIKLHHRLVPAHDNVPGGISFAYTKARDGNRTELVLYTSVGLEYGNEAAHAKITDLSVSRPAA